jgi:hypothetical protein
MEPVASYSSSRRSLDHLELATAEWVDRWNHRPCTVPLADYHQRSMKRSTIATEAAPAA